MTRVAAALEGVKFGVANRVVKGAVAKVARRAAKDAKTKAPRGATGLVSKSIGTRYKSYRNSGVWVYAIGPRVGFRTVGPGGRPEVATKVAHFAERGRRAVSPKPGKTLAFYTLKGRAGGKGKRKVGSLIVTRKSVRPALGSFFMAAAWREVVVSKVALEREILAGVEREAMKYSAIGKSIYG